MMKNIVVLFGLMTVNAFAVESPSDILQKTPLDHMREINQQNFLKNTALPGDLTQSLLVRLQAVLMKPIISKDAACLILKDCVSLLFQCRRFLDQKIQLSENIEALLDSKADMMYAYSNELFLIHNLCLHCCLIYFDGNIPEGLLDISVELINFSDTKKFPRLVHLKTSMDLLFYVHHC